MQEGRDEKARLENELFKLTNRSPHLETALLEVLHTLLAFYLRAMLFLFVGNRSIEGSAERGT